MKNELIDILGNVGIDTEDGDEEAWLLELDSLRFINAIIEIEQQFHIEIPDEYLVSEQLFSSLDRTIEVIQKLQGDSSFRLEEGGENNENKINKA